MRLKQDKQRIITKKCIAITLLEMNNKENILKPVREKREKFKSYRIQKTADFSQEIICPKTMKLTLQNVKRNKKPTQDFIKQKCHAKFKMTEQQS